MFYFEDRTYICQEIVLALRRSNVVTVAKRVITIDAYVHISLQDKKWML